MIDCLVFNGIVGMCIACIELYGIYCCKLALRYNAQI